MRLTTKQVHWLADAKVLLCRLERDRSFHLWDQPTLGSRLSALVRLSGHRTLCGSTEPFYMDGGLHPALDDICLCCVREAQARDLVYKQTRPPAKAQ